MNAALNAENAVELDHYQHRLASMLVAAMEEEASSWDSVELLVAHEGLDERVAIKYRVGDRDWSLASWPAVEDLVFGFRQRLERGGFEGVQRWRLTVVSETGRYRLDTSREQPWHGSIGWPDQAMAVLDE